MTDTDTLYHSITLLSVVHEILLQHVQPAVLLHAHVSTDLLVVLSTDTYTNDLSKAVAHYCCESVANGAAMPLNTFMRCSDAFHIRGWIMLLWQLPIVVTLVAAYIECVTGKVRTQNKQCRCLLK
jgi:hypothetical protein